MQRHAYHMINVEIMKVHVGQILPRGRVTGNKKLRIGGLIVINNGFCIIILNCIKVDMMISYITCEWNLGS